MIEILLLKWPVVVGGVVVVDVVIDVVVCIVVAAANPHLLSGKNRLSIEILLLKWPLTTATMC